MTGAEVNNMIEGNFVTQISGIGYPVRQRALDGNATGCRGPIMPW